MIIDKNDVPPQNLIAEQQVLSAMLLNSNTRIEMSSVLKPEHFYFPINRNIFEAIIKNKTSDLSVISKVIDDPEGKLFDLPEMASFRDCSKSAFAVRDTFSRRLLIEFAYGLISEAKNNYESTAQEIMNASVSKVVRSITFNTKSKFQRLGDGLLQLFEELDQFRNGTKKRAIETGLSDVDEKLYIDNADLVIIAGRPSMGKSAFLSQVMRHNSKKGKKGIFFSTEMSKKMELARSVYSEAGVNYQNVRNGTSLPKYEYEKISIGADIISKLDLYIDDTPKITPNQIRSVCNILKSECGLDFIAQDYIGLGKPDDVQKSRREDFIEQIHEYKNIAKEFDVPFLVLSQLNKAVESRDNKRPMNSDLQESGEVEATADSIIFLYRDYYYSKDEKVKNVCEILCGKQRNGPAPFKAEVYCDLSIGKFADLNTTQQEPEETDNGCDRF